MTTILATGIHNRLSALDHEIDALLMNQTRDEREQRAS
ncbi:hypothetical protein ACVWXQ_000764 [Bradyrhizobium sp. S3.14.4]